MQAAVLSTRNRGAAVLIGIPREDTMLSVPARTIPRMERRILGSIYGSARPERDFLTTLDVYRSGRLPLDRLVSHRLPLAEVNEAIDLMLSGEALRVVLDTTDGRSVMTRIDLAELDGRIGEGWGGLSPNGCHVNVVLAHRGSPTAAAAISMFAHPSPGHSPVLCCVGEAQTAYEPIWPPTLMMNKTTATTPEIETMTWGAGQLGIGKAVLDSVAAGLIEASGDLIVLVAIWLDGRADDETAVLQAARTAVGKAIRMCVEGRDPEAAAALVAQPGLGHEPVLRRRVRRRGGQASACQRQALRDERDRVRACLVAVAAAGLVGVERADDDRLARVRRRPAVDEPLGRRRGAAAAVADGLQLVHELGVGEQLRHDAEGQPAEVLVEARDDDPDPAVGQRERRTDDRVVEELHLVDADHVVPGRAGDELRDAVDRDGPHPCARVRDDVGRRRSDRRCAA